MNWRCLFFGHALHQIAPLYNECVRCGKTFHTDYFESRARGQTVRFEVTAKEAASAKAEKKLPTVTEAVTEIIVAYEDRLEAARQELAAAKVSKSMPIWRHEKTGNLYALVDYAIDCTNGRNNSEVVIYRRPDGSGQTYVRDRAEFEQKFTQRTNP